MRRPLVLVLALLALGALAWLAVDRGWLAGGAQVERTDDAVEAPRESDAEQAALAARAAVTDPATFEGDPVGTLTLRLGDASVHGLVTGSGAPLRLARVAVVLPPPANQVAVRTTKEGRFTIAGLASESYELRASADGFRSRTLATPLLAPGASSDLGEIALTVRPPQSDGIEVKVVDGAGKPVVGAKVTVTSLTYGLFLAMPPEMHGVQGVQSKDAVTDASGVALLAPLPPEKYDVVARAAGFALEVIERVVLASGRVERVTIKLSPGLTIAGTVVGPSGEGLSGGHVFAMHQPTFRSYEAVQTEAGGAFLLTGLDPGSYWIFAGHDDYGIGNDRKAKAGDQGLRIALQGAGTLAGRVVRPDGKPATKFVLRPYPPGQPFGYVYSILLAFEDADGRFERKVPPGNYQVDAKEEGGGFVPGPKVTVKEGERAEVEIRLAAHGTVRGVVVDSAGEHVAGAEVYVQKGGFPPTPVRELTVRTDADGAFRLDGMPLERVGLYVRHPAHALQTFDVTPAPPDAAKEMTIRLSKGSRVEGRVLQTDDRPVAGEQVNLFKGFDFFNAKTTFTDGEGRFAFLAVAPDTYQVSTGKFENAASGEQKPVTVPPDGVATVEFRTQSHAPGTVVVVGKVTAGDKPVSGATVYGVDDRGFEASVTTTTDAQGRYELKGLEPGSIRVTAQTTDGLTTSKRIEGAANQTATLDLTYGNQRVVGRLVEEDGRTGIPGGEAILEVVDATAGDGWGAVRAWVTTDKEGKFLAGGVEPGTYRVRAQAMGHAPRILDPFALGAGDVKDVGTIRLSLGAALTGRVTDGDGRPVENASIGLKDESGKDVFLFSLSSTGSDGRYDVQGLVPGRYSLRVEAKGYAFVEKSISISTAGASEDAVLQRGGAVAVVVEDETGKPVGSARVEIQDGQGRPVTRTISIVNIFDADFMRTGADGRTTVPDLAPGSYAFSAKKDGMVLAGEPASVSVGSGRTSSVRVVLKAAASGSQ